MNLQSDSSYLLRVLSHFAQHHCLTDREKEILFYLSRYGYSNKHLANELFITEKTVKNHMARIQEKTKTCSTRELLSMVVAQSLMHQLREEAVAL